MKIILKSENLYKSYYTKPELKTEVLKNISIDIFENEFVAVMGPSGAGKSTLLYLLGSLEQPDTGKIELNINGSVISYSDLNPHALDEIRNKHIGFVFQFHHLLPEFNTLENVMMPSMIAGFSFSDASGKANVLMNKVGIIHRSNHKPSELSGGEQQRAAIARALINTPSIVLADEPTGNLDLKNSRSVMHLMENLRKEHSLTYIVATHSAEVAALADRKIYMADGEIVEIK